MQYSQKQQSADSQVGIYGWRKRCLYALLLTLSVVVLLNLVATFFVLHIINFNLGGLGYLTIVTNGVQLRDYSYVLGPLLASHVTSRRRQDLSFESWYNMSLTLRDDSGLSTQSVHFWSDHREPNRHEVITGASQLRVQDLRGRALFTAEDGKVTVGTDILRVVDGGAHFSGSVQTSMVRSGLGDELMLESATRRLLVTAPTGVFIESRAADISASCLTNLQLSAADGKIRMKAPGIYLPNLESIPLLQPQPSRYLKLEPASASRVYQMCVCSNGKMFVSQPDGECSVDNDSLQCR